MKYAPIQIVNIEQCLLMPQNAGDTGNVHLQHWESFKIPLMTKVVWPTNTMQTIS